MFVSPTSYTGLHVIMKRNYIMMEKGKFTNILTILIILLLGWLKVRVRGHLVNLGTAFSLPITHKLLVRLISIYDLQQQCTPALPPSCHH